MWDIEIAFEFPNAKVIGIDYESATVSSLTETVKNFTFQNAMIHQGKSGLETIENNAVDYIMMRDVMLVNSPVQKWINIFKEVYRILKPGGYIEIYEQGKIVCFVESPWHVLILFTCIIIYRHASRVSRS